MRVGIAISQTFAPNMHAENSAKSPVALGFLQTGIATLVIFGGWCAIDFYEVSRPDYPDRVHDNEWMLLLLPIPAFLASYWIGRIRESRSQVGIAILTTALAIPLSIPTILLFGIWFHFAIGGRL
jgi:hypothetical protein